MSFRNILITTTITAIVLTLSLSWPTLSNLLHQSLQSHIKKQQQASLGKLLPKDFLVYDTSGASHQLRRLYPEGVVLMLYSRNCPACQRAAAHAEKKLKSSISSTSARFALLEFAQDFHEDLKFLEHTTTYRTELRQGQTLFKGRGMPRFYVIDSSGEVVYTQVGWNADSLDIMLDNDISYKRKVN